MTNVTNHTRETLSFQTGDKAGRPVFESLGPGETKDISLDLKDAQVQGRILSGVISVPASVASRVEAAAAADEQPRAKPR